MRAAWFFLGCLAALLVLGIYAELGVRAIGRAKG